MLHIFVLQILYYGTPSKTGKRPSILRYTEYKILKVSVIFLIGEPLNDVLVYTVVSHKFSSSSNKKLKYSEGSLSIQNKLTIPKIYDTSFEFKLGYFLTFDDQVKRRKTVSV